MTHQERVEIERAAPSGVVLSWLPHEESRFVRLLAGPCPLLKGQGCTVYKVRPYNCRRFGCVRDDYTEPYDWHERALNRQQKRSLVMLQRKATPWAVAHGWTEDHA